MDDELYTIQVPKIEYDICWCHTLITNKTNTDFTCILSHSVYTHEHTYTHARARARAHRVYTYKTYIIISEVVSGELTRCKIEFYVHILIILWKMGVTRRWGTGRRERSYKKSTFRIKIVYPWTQNCDKGHSKFFGLEMINVMVVWKLSLKCSGVCLLVVNDAEILRILYGVCVCVCKYIYIFFIAVIFLGKCPVVRCKSVILYATISK